MGKALLSVLVIGGMSLFAAPENTRAAEESKPAPLVLGLPEVIRMAIQKSPEMGEIRSDIRSTESDLAQVKAAYYPQLETTGLFGPIDDAKEPLIVNGRITDPSPSLSWSHIGVFGRLDMTLTQPLYTFGKLSNREEAAARGVRAKELTLDERRGKIVIRVKELYYAFVLARAGLEMAKEAGNFFDDAGRRIQRLIDLGSTNVSQSDLYRVEAYRAGAVRARAEAEKGARVSYFALKAFLGLPPEADFEPADKSLPSGGEVPGPVTQYLEQALAQRPEFKQLAEALAAQEYQVKAATSDRYPSFFAALTGSLAGAPGREALYNRYIPDQFNHAYGGVVAGMKWNFDFGIAKAKIEKAKAEYEKLLSSKALAKMNIPIQVVKSYQEHLEYRAAVDSYRSGATASRKWILTAMSDFDMGVGTAYDMLNAIDRYSQNQGRYLESLLRYNLTLAELEYAAGIKTW